MAREMGSLLAFVTGAVGSVLLLNEAQPDFFWALSPQLLGCLAFGWFARAWRWAGVGLAFVPVAIAMPFGVNDERFYEGPPLDALELLLSPLYLAVILVAMAARGVYDRARGSSTATS